MANQSKPAFRFLDLPPELRIRVYSYLLVEEPTIVPGCTGKATGVSRGHKFSRLQNMTIGLLRVCQIVRKEATPIAYGDNWFGLSKSIFPAIAWLVMIGSSVQYLRRVFLGAWVNQSDYRHTLILLKQATQLSKLFITTCTWHRQWAAEKIAKELGPLIRSLHKSQKKDTRRKDYNVLDILTISRYEPCDRCNTKDIKKLEVQVQELLAKTLK